MFITKSIGDEVQKGPRHFYAPPVCSEGHIVQLLSVRAYIAHFSTILVSTTHPTVLDAGI